MGCGVVVGCCGFVRCCCCVVVSLFIGFGYDGEFGFLFLLVCVDCVVVGYVGIGC